MGKDHVEFKGWDWRELEQLVGQKFDNDQVASQAIRQYLINAAVAQCGNGDAHVAAHVRQFLLALERDQWVGFSKPFYRGLREVEHDGMMLRLVAHFLEYLWT